MGWQLSNKLPKGRTFPKTLQVASKLIVFGMVTSDTKVAFREGELANKNTSPPLMGGDGVGRKGLLDA